MSEHGAETPSFDARFTNLESLLEGLVGQIAKLGGTTEQTAGLAAAAGATAEKAGAVAQEAGLEAGKAGAEANKASKVASFGPQKSFQPLRPEKFTGDDVENWVDAMDDYLLATGLVASEGWIFHVASYFTGKAYTWWRYYKQCVLRGAALAPADWAAFKALLVSQFREKLEKRRAMDELEALQQTKDVRSYTSAFQAIIIDLPELDEDYKRYRYCNGLKPEIQAVVEQQLPATVDKAIELATVADSVATRIKSRKTTERAAPKTTPPPRRAESAPAAPDEGPVPMELGVGKTSKDTGKDARRCFKCGQTGHVKAQCPMLQ